MEPRPVIKRLGERVGAEALPNEAEAIARLRQTIVNAKRTLEENRIIRENLTKRLAEIEEEERREEAEIKGESLEGTILSIENLRARSNLLKKELEETSILKRGKRRELETQISDLEKTIREKGEKAGFI
jgi:hypothetical protein